MDVIARNNVKVLGTEGPTLLYAHGFGCHQDMWTRITPAFAQSHRQILFDYVGCGKSDMGAFEPLRYASLDGYAQDVLEICDALGLQSGITFVGHSVSCSIGMLASIARPGLFEHMVFVGPTPCFLNDPPDYVGGFEREDLEGLIALIAQNFMGWANHLAPVVAGESGAGAVTTELSDSFCSTDPTAARVFANATFFADNRADLARFSCPSLILQHQRDSLAPTNVGDYLHAQLKDSTLKVLDVSGHCAHLSDPQLVIDAMHEYLGAATIRA